MHAAVVRSFDAPPRYEEHETPAPSAPHDALVDVLGAGLHPRVRSQANGSHYTRSDELPLVPGIDGIGRLADGSLAYFVLPDTRMGSMAEQTVVDTRRSVALPADTEVDVVAAAMNPAMSSWVALRRRIAFEPGQSVLVLGATGNAGQLAVQIAKHLGAGRVVAAGRDPGRLAGLAAVGADETLPLDGVGAAADVDVVIDYLWGTPAEAAMTTVVTSRRDRSALLRWVQIGAVAGPTVALPSALLRASNLHILGSGQGSVATADLLAELPALAAEISAGTFGIRTRVVPLSAVESAWAEPADPTRRTVITP